MNEDILTAFGNRVRELRLEKKLTQEKLSLVCDMDRTYISGIERGIRNISLINISRLAEALDVAPAELLQFGGKYVK